MCSRQCLQTLLLKGNAENLQRNHFLPALPTHPSSFFYIYLELDQESEIASTKECSLN